MYLVAVFVLVAVLGVPTRARPQALELRAAAGPTLVDRGYSLAAGAGWAPWSRLTLSINVERTTLSSRTSTDNRGGTSGFRGGTVTIGTAEVQVSLLPRDRLTPYLLGGFAAGVSRPTVNATFPRRVGNDVRAVFGGGGIHVPLRPRLGLFADTRLLIGEEANELLAYWPVRVGLIWRF